MNKILSTRFKNVFSLEEEINISENIFNKRKYFYNDAFYQTLSASEIESLERNNSNKYRFNFSLTSYASNVLFNISGQDSYESVTENRNFIEDENDFEYAIEDILKNDKGKYFYLDLSNEESCTKNFLIPRPDDLNFVSNIAYNNYLFFLAYSHEKVNDFQINNIPLSEGLSIFSSSTLEYVGRTMTECIVNIPHNLNTGDQVKIDENIYSVYALGLNSTYSFIIDEELSLINTSFKRIFNGVESEYWFRKYKTFSNVLDIYRSGFSKSIYSSQNFSLSSSDFNSLAVKDCFNRDLNEIYLGIVKRRGTSYSPTLFTPVVAGLDNFIVNTQYDIKSINSTGNPDTYIEQLSIDQSEYYGDIVEYNPLSQQITSLIDVNHLFNTINRNENGHLESYYYKPFYPIKIKEFSNFIDTYESEPPESAFQIHSRRYIDRPLLSNSDGDLFPFINGHHYVHANICFYLKRQDPCHEILLNSLEPLIKNVCVESSQEVIVEDNC